jgi:hypothetical protein
MSKIPAYILTFVCFFAFSYGSDAGDLGFNNSNPKVAQASADSAAGSATTSSGSVKPFADTASAIKQTVANQIFAIPVRPFETHSDRLADCKVVTEDLTERSNIKGPFRDYSDFRSRGLAKNATKVRTCGIKGLPDVHIVLTENYARRLDDRALDKEEGLGADLRKRVTAADMPQFIEEMPDPRYFKRIFISDKPNTEDDWVTQIYYSKGFVSASSMIESELDLYKTNLTDYLRRDVMHEWSHELRFKFWADPVRDLFHDAVQVDSWNPRPYAARGDSEQWAVLGEKLLGTNADEFIEACDKAPIKTTLWMRALKSCLLNVPVEFRSIDHTKYMERADFVFDQIRPKALESLQTMRSKEATPSQQALLDRLIKQL